MPIKDTIILTVYNRPELTLLNTLISVRKQDLTDTEVLIIDDGSDIDYSDVQELLTDWNLPYKWHRISTIENRPETYHIDGHNNPSYVNNEAVKLAEGENVYFLSSDTVIPPNTMGSARIWDLDKAVYTIRVIDMDSGVEWNGISRPYPMCWFLGVSKALFNRIGGFDEEYLNGMAFEDSDFSARASIETRKLIIDVGTLGLHQSHPQIAYSDAGKGVKWSQTYTKKKWGGVPPWDDSGPPLNYTVSQAGDKVILKPRPSDATLALLSKAVAV